MAFKRRRSGISGGILCTGLLLSLAVLNCSAQGRVKRLETRTLSIERSGAPPVPIRVEIARTDEERGRGLMYREKLPDGEGMIFVFDRAQLLSFWMKNTLIPLSIAFIAADGRILEIRHMEPGSLTPINSAYYARYALEVPRGWFSRAGVGEGDLLRLDF